MTERVSYTLDPSPTGKMLSIRFGRVLIDCDFDPEENWLTFLLFTNPHQTVQYDSGNLTLNATPELLALRQAVIDKEAPPAVLADLVEELRDCWVEGHYEAEEVLAKLRECW